MTEIQSGLSGAGAPVPIIGDGWVQLEGSQSQKVSWDELSQAEQVLVLQYLLNAQSPQLTPPSSVDAGNNANAIGSIASLQSLGSIEAKNHEIISAILDSWIEGIKEIADAQKADDIRKQQEKTELNRQIQGLSNVNAAYRASENYASDPNFNGITLGIIITGTGITEAMMVDSGVSGVNPVQDIANRTIAPLSNDLSMLIPVFCMCAVYQASLQVVSEASSSEEPKNLDFANKFAENIMGLIGSTNFSSFLSVLITANVANGAPVGADRMNQLMASLKLVLLSSALALVYIAEAGKMTDVEFQAMLNGTMTFPEGDIKSKLLASIQVQLSAMAPTDKAMILNALSSFFNSNPSMDALSNPATVFAGLNRALPRGDIIA